MQPSERDSSTYIYLLRGAAAVCALTGLGVVIWLVDKAIRFPEIQATQAGAHAPLWIPFALFVALSTVVMVWLFLKAARRVDAGERLFDQRHRRRASDERQSISDEQKEA